MDEREYQDSIKARLDRVYGEVIVQWHPFLGHGRQIYAPVVDVAVGPFAIETRHGPRYTELLEETRPFIELLIEKHNSNIKDAGLHTSFQSIQYFNENARCLLCIEIEDSGSEKHCLGDLVNASALGRVGVLVARSGRTFNAFLRQRVYLDYLASVGKNTFRTNNALVLTTEQFDECLASLPL